MGWIGTLIIVTMVIVMLEKLWNTMKGEKKRVPKNQTRRTETQNQPTDLGTTS